MTGSAGDDDRWHDENFIRPAGSATAPCAPSAEHGVAPRQDGRSGRPVGSLRLERLYRDDAALRAGGAGREDLVKPKYVKFIGIDWGSEKHQACAIDAKGKRKEWSFAHTAAGLADLVRRLERMADGKPKRIAVGIETPRSAVVEICVERGFHVFAINPKQLDRFRDRFSVAGAKDDRLDAYVIADSLRTDEHCFRRVEVDSPLTIQLRELSRLDENLTQDKVRLGHQLAAQLNRYYPQLLPVCPGVDEPWFWSLLEKAPTPAQGRALTPSELTELLISHRKRRVSTRVAALHEALQQKALQVAPGVAEAASVQVMYLIERLRLIEQQRLRCDKELEALLEQISREQRPAARPRQPSDVAIFRSFAGIGPAVTAIFLSEAAQAVANRDYRALRMYSGVAPVTRATGKRSGHRAMVTIRRGCSHRLRWAVHAWAKSSVVYDPRSRAHYQDLRARGHAYSRALRGVGDRLLKVLVAALRDGRLYDAARDGRPLVRPVAEVKSR
jgi:transposase